MKKYYHDFFDLVTPVNDYCLGHGNGYGVSLMFKWSGDQHEFFNISEYEGLYSSRLNLLNNISYLLDVEHHFFRGPCFGQINDYIDHGNKAVRCQELSSKVRKIHADHLTPFSFSNSVYTVLRLNSGKQIKNRAGSSDKIYKAWSVACVELMKEFDKLSSFYNGASLLKVSEYLDQVTFSALPSLEGSQHVNYDYDYDLAEQIYLQKPVAEDDFLRIGNTYIANAVVYNTPNLGPDWFLGFAQNTDCGVHVTQLLKRLDRSKVLDSAAAKSKRTEDSADDTKGKWDTAFAVNDIENFQKVVSENDFEVYKNAYLYQFYSDDKDVLERSLRDTRNVIEAQEGRLESNRNIQYHLYRASQPGQGCRCEFGRDDFSLALAAMMPFTVFNNGDNKPECIRLTSSGQVIGYSPGRFKVGHEILVAKTGGGKGTQMGVEILESYPFGLDYYILEYGDTFKWVVEAYGGSYYRLSPDVCLNPLPDYPDKRHCASDTLPNSQIIGTVASLGFILLDGARELSVAERAVAENSLNELYKSRVTNIIAPTLPMYMEAIKALDASNNQQNVAKSLIYDNLYNFLDTKTGEPFRDQDNLKLHDHLCGVDMMGVPESMTKFYISFVALKYAHKAFFTLERVAKVVLDELHMPMKIAPDVTRNLVSALNRMGRKEGGQCGLSTQGMAEITKIDEEVISSSPIRTLLVRDDKWSEISDLLSIPDGVKSRWMEFERNIDDLPYRQGIRHLPSGWHDLFLTFPEFFLDVTTTTRHERVMKRDIEDTTSDLFERVRLLKEKRVEYEKNN